MNKKIAKIFISLFVTFLTMISVQASTLSTNVAWIWMKGANITNQPGTYGTQGVAAPANTPGARYGAVSWTDGLGVLWLFGGYGYAVSMSAGNLNDLWKYDPATTNWTWMKGTNTTMSQKGIYGTQGVADPANTPGPRQGAISWTDGLGALWLFGGYGDDSIEGSEDDLNDLWKYDPATTNWTWMKGADIKSQPGTYGAQGVAAPANTPGARDGAISWTDGSGALWLFGGYGYPASGRKGYLNDLWKYDPATTNWTWMKGANTKGQIGTYGTQGVADPANTPGARYNAVSWTDGTGALWLFGGEGYPASGSDGYLNDLWKYDPATTNWTWMKGADTKGQIGTYGMQGVANPTNTPGARVNAVSWTDAVGALWLFGGDQGWGRLNDLWKYDPVITNWTWMKGATNINQNGTYGTQGVADPTNTPGARDSAISWTDGTGALWLFGGQNFFPAFGGGYLNDLWKYNVGGGISFTTNALVFHATYQGTNPAAQTIVMTNVGGSAFTYTNIITYSAGASGWLTVLPAAGTVALNGATILTNRVNITGLGAGTYYATNQITSADAVNSPQTVVVTLTVNMADMSSCVCTDFDGDGLADPALYNTNGTWSIKLSSGGYTRLDLAGFLGGSGYSAIAGDFDGDRLADPVIYNAALELWAVKLSSLNYLAPTVLTSFGGSGWAALAGDFDGDRLADPALYNTNGTWKVKLSTAGYTTITVTDLLGYADWTAIAADFDGDGKVDPAIYKASTGSWIVMMSKANYGIAVLEAGFLGSTGYVGMAADFDGDGYADPAVAQSSTGNWKIKLSSGNYSLLELNGFLSGQ